MVKNRDEVEAIVRAYVKEVEKDYRVTQAILFGSYASGTATEWSDIDLAIVSPDFRGKPEMEILQHLSRKTLNVSSLLEVVAFTPEELESPDHRTFSWQVKSRGIPIAA